VVSCTNGLGPLLDLDNATFERKDLSAPGTGVALGENEDVPIGTSIVTPCPRPTALGPVCPEQLLRVTPTSATTMPALSRLRTRVMDHPRDSVHIFNLVITQIAYLLRSRRGRPQGIFI